MNMTVVLFFPSTFKSNVDCEPYVLVAGGAISTNSLQGPDKEGAVATLLGLGRQAVRPEPMA